MLERLDYVRIRPRRILDAGSGPGTWARALGERYPHAEVLALDFSRAMLAQADPGWLQRLMRGRRYRRVCADFTRLPFAPGSFDLVWCNMALHWSDPLAAFAEFQRTLATEGLLMFTTLGPDSLKELRAAAGGQRVHNFIDMHDLGDMLIAAGFSAPVMDMEMLSVAYAEPQRLLEDLRLSGQTSARVDRMRGLTGKRFLGALRTALTGVSQATYEVVYGHAWKGAPKTDAQGRAIVQVELPRHRRTAGRT